MTSRFKPQATLRWLALLVLVVAVGLGWYADHQRAEEQLERLPGEIEVAKLQLYDASLRLAESVPRPQFVSQNPNARRLVGSSLIADVPGDFAWTVEEFIAKLKQASKPVQQRVLGEKYGYFKSVAFQLYNAPDDKFNKAFVPLLKLGEHPDPPVRQGMLQFVETMLNDAPQRVEPFHSHIVSLLVELLDDQDPAVRRQAIRCLQVMGPQASQALEPLRKIVASRQDLCRVPAALAIAAIDGRQGAKVDVREMIRARNLEWESAVKWLIEQGPSDSLEAFLREQFEMSSPRDRQVFAVLLNDLSLARMEDVKEIDTNDD